MIVWPSENAKNMIYLTASTLSASTTPGIAAYKEAIEFLGRTIKSRRLLGLCSAGYEHDLLAAITILKPVELITAAKKLADELSVNR